MTILEEDEESQIIANVEMKSSFKTKWDAIMIKWRDIFVEKALEKNVNEVTTIESTSKYAFVAKLLLQERKRSKVFFLEGCKKRNERMHARNIMKFFEIKCLHYM